MKIILSRKGFDSKNGGIPSPLMPDGTLLSLPIPSSDEGQYRDLAWETISYEELLKELHPGWQSVNCHIDPDLAPGRRIRQPENWQPAFGQIHQSQRYLSQTAKAEPGDLFLFFGTFRKVERSGGGFRYVRKTRENRDGCEFHAIFGYLQIGEILTEPEKIARCFWHPHACRARLSDPTNALYLPEKQLSFAPGLPGCGYLPYDERRVLTMPGRPKGTWKDNPVYRPEAVVGNRRNSAEGTGIYYAGIWQELALRESAEAELWAKSLF
jgi:hypothetical protein